MPYGIVLTRRKSLAAHAFNIATPFPRIVDIWFRPYKMRGKTAKVRRGWRYCSGGFQPCSYPHFSLLAGEQMALLAR